VVRFAGLVPAGARVLDLACGGGRHTRFFLDRRHPVTAVDIDLAGIADLAGRPDLESIEADLEGGAPWPLADRRFAGIVVTNYLHRPILTSIVAAVAPGGALIYETFAVGNERFGRPTNPDFLLRPGELIDAVQGRLEIVAYESLEVAEPKPAMVQRIAVVDRGD
jgi:SAM-dependent methyltransferase